MLTQLIHVSFFLIPILIRDQSAISFDNSAHKGLKLVRTLLVRDHGMARASSANRHREQRCVVRETFSAKLVAVVVFCKYVPQCRVDFEHLIHRSESVADVALVHQQDLHGRIDFKTFTYMRESAVAKRIIAAQVQIRDGCVCF